MVNICVCVAVPQLMPLSTSQFAVKVTIVVPGKAKIGVCRNNAPFWNAYPFGTPLAWISQGSPCVVKSSCGTKEFSPRMLKSAALGVANTGGCGIWTVVLLPLESEILSVFITKVLHCVGICVPGD